MSSDPGLSSNKEDASQSARPRPVSYTETTRADDEFERKPHRRQHRLEHTEASREEVQPKDTNTSHVNSELQRKLQKRREKSESTIG